MSISFPWEGSGIVYDPVETRLSSTRYRTDGQTDRQTDGRTADGILILVLPLCWFFPRAPKRLFSHISLHISKNVTSLKYFFAQ